MLWFIVPVDPKISWEGHLSGLVVGLLLAFVFQQKIVKKPKYDWEKEDYNPENDVFMSHFDENGNFIETVEKESVDLDSSYNYIFKENKEE
jgi:hypothetical protein